MLQYLTTKTFFNPGSTYTGCMCPEILSPASSTEITCWESKRAESGEEAQEKMKYCLRVGMTQLLVNVVLEDGR